MNSKRSFPPMSLSAFRRLGSAAWLVAIALVANLAAQDQLAFNVVEAAIERTALAAPADPHAHHHGQDHAQNAAPLFSAEDMVLCGASPGQDPSQNHAQLQSQDHSHRHADAGGHTHKGHADCAVCGVAAVLAALTLPATIVFQTPSGFARPADATHADLVRSAARYTLYLSRAPPILA